MPNKSLAITKNRLFIISGPSGSGQDSVIEGLKKFLPIRRIITTTTRPKRPGEKQGRPYYFTTRRQFFMAVKKNKFFEHAQEYNGHYYGVTLEEITKARRSKKINIWKIEYKGVASAKKLMPNIVAICLNAPLKILVKRIKERDQASEKFIQERKKYTKKWLKHLDIYDYVVVNEQGKLDQTIKKVVKIIKKYLD
jgi:guanylate kinase